MKLTTKGRYAVMAMADLALFKDRGPTSLTDISLRQNISVAYLEQIFIKLKNKNLVKSIRGAKGGYVLEISPENIKISNRILNFVMSPGYKTNYPVFSVKARAWKDRSEPQHAKNCRKLWDSPKGKEIRKHLKRLKGKLPIMYKQEINPLFKK